MGFTVQTINAFEMTHRMAACEIKAARPGHRAFIGVYPPWPEKDLHRWRVRRFEIPEYLIYGNFGELDLLDATSVLLNTMLEVENLLATWEIDSALLDAPWKCDYPL